MSIPDQCVYASVSPSPAIQSGYFVPVQNAMQILQILQQGLRKLSSFTCVPWVSDIIGLTPAAVAVPTDGQPSVGQQQGNVDESPSQISMELCVDQIEFQDCVTIIWMACIQKHGHGNACRCMDA